MAYFYREILNNYVNIKSEISQEQDFESIKKVLAGDSSAFANLQNKYTRIVASLIRRMIRDEDDIDDLVQDTFIKAYKALDTFQFSYSFSAWLYRIASNTCIDFLRKKRFNMISLSKPMENSEDDQFFEIEDNSYSPENDVIMNERINALNTAVEKLPDNYKEIIKLRHEHEMDYNEIALRLDLPLGTVKAHLFRARKLMLTYLKKEAHLFRD